MVNSVYESENISLFYKCLSYNNKISFLIFQVIEKVFLIKSKIDC